MFGCCGEDVRSSYPKDDVTVSFSFLLVLAKTNLPLKGLGCAPDSPTPVDLQSADGRARVKMKRKICREAEIGEGG